MNRAWTVFAWAFGFLLLDLYVNLVPRWVGLAVPVWLAWVAGFFVLAFVVCRYGLGLSAASLGLHRPRGWLRLLAVGFGVGLGVWMLKYAVYLAMDKFELAGWRDAGDVLPMLAQALLAMFFASAINDILIRGYGLACCRRFGLLRWYVPLTALVYALDDAWNAGLDPANLVFSLVLGACLAWTVLRTGTLWMSIGIHWGGNMAFRCLAGFDGNGVPLLSNVREGAAFDYAGIAITALILPCAALAAWLAGRPWRSSAAAR
jgi:hypothetical protein